ncbi:MAG: tetratricopeptide repeat protein, partial [Betaproteobacteria bacterium]|nr:tetratricopeptide repeat protein [Betaproteobacteria bacterium]
MRKIEPSAEEVDQLLALFQQKRFADGEALARTLARTCPQSAFVWKSLGVCLNLLGRKRDAAEAMTKAAALNPGDAEIHFNLGTTLNDLERWEEAEPCFRRAIGLKPGYIEALNNLGDALANLGRAEDAEEVLRRAIETRPDGLEAHFNLGNALRRQRRFGEAESSFRRALELQPGNVEAHHNLGFLLLSLGRYTEGWPHYETRYHPQKKGRPVTPPDVLFPQWQGEPLAGKSLLIWPEQGFGDEIQFARYVPLLKAGGVSRLTLVCKPPLKALLETVTGTNAVITSGEPLDSHDYWAFPLSLPLHFGTTLETVPAALPYLTADPRRIERWRPRLPEAG